MVPEKNAHWFQNWFQFAPALGAHFEKFVKSLVESGRFSDADVVVRQGLELLEDQEKVREIRIKELQAAIQEGIDSGEATPIEDVISKIRVRRAARRGLIG